MKKNCQLSSVILKFGKLNVFFLVLHANVNYLKEPMGNRKKCIKKNILKIMKVLNTKIPTLEYSILGVLYCISFIESLGLQVLFGLKLQ